MKPSHLPRYVVQNRALYSKFLLREVELDIFLPQHVGFTGTGLRLLMINDGQLLTEMGIDGMLGEVNAAQPLLCVGIHAGADRKDEYGVSKRADYLGRGAKAGSYTSFVLQELLPYITSQFKIESSVEKVFAGFSLGALMALDIVWNHPGIFSKAGLFSGSFWWRSVDQYDKAYSDDKHRIMHQVIRDGSFKPGLKFFFQCGNKDETLDRNNNGIIDSIDDTLDIISELVKKGYDRQRDVFYLEMPDGRHDVATWTKAMPVFLKWAFQDSD